MNLPDIVRKLKNKGRSPQSFIPIETVEGIKGYLRPVHADREIAAKMAKWRTANFDAFFTWIKPSEDDVLQWLKRQEEIDNDIIFMIELPAGISVGQIALYGIDFYQNTAKIGRIIKGRKECPEGIMTLAAETLVRWGFGCLKLEKIFLEVFTDNERAVSLYKRLGFRVSEMLLFKRTKTPQGVVRWVSVKKGQGTSPIHQYRKVCQMALQRKDLKL